MISTESFYHTHGESLHCGPSSLSQVPVCFKASPALTRFKLTKLGHQPNSKFIVPDQFPSPPPWRRGFLYNVRPTGWHWITSSSSSSFTGEPFLFNPIHLIDQSIVCSHQVGGRVSLSLSLWRLHPWDTTIVCVLCPCFSSPLGALALRPPLPDPNSIPWVKS